MRFHDTFPGPAYTLEPPSFDDPAALLDHCGALGISLWTNGPKLSFDAPNGALTADLRSELVRHKPALLALLRPAPTKPTKPPAFDLSQRWGPGLNDGQLGITIPHDWRTAVARWPHAKWTAWRERSTEILDALGHEPTVEGIQTADRAAYLELAENL